jgi:hypothetical protein
MLDIMEILVMHLAKRVVPVPLRILEQVLGQQRVQIALLGSTRCLRTLLRVLFVVPVPLRILEQILGQQHAPIVPLVCILYPPTWNRV